MYFSSKKFQVLTRPILLNDSVDGEVSIHRSHLVTEAQCNTPDHVLCMIMSVIMLLSVSPPFVNPEPLPFLSKKTELYTDVVEVPPQGSSGALRDNCVSFQSDVYIFWNVDSLIAENSLHSCGRCSKELFFPFVVVGVV